MGVGVQNMGCDVFFFFTGCSSVKLFENVYCSI